MKKSQGFTLIEVLLVVLLIGIVSGIVLLAASPNDSSRLIASETNRLAEAISLAADEAVSENQQLGLMLDEKSYRFLTFDDRTRQWLASDNPVFSPYELPTNISLHILKDDASKTLALTTQDSKKQDKESLMPQVVLLSSGETSSVILEFSAQDGDPQTLTLDELGSITLSTDDKNEPSPAK
ncbi:MAG: type II secretion system minor pseudopilin GspH [Agitococcus sp.]|nr:type II secretion system minor pseudopilin GspH [Agitococcus sp.]